MPTSYLLNTNSKFISQQPHVLPHINKPGCPYGCLFYPLKSNFYCVHCAVFSNCVLRFKPLGNNSYSQPFPVSKASSTVAEPSTKTKHNKCARHLQQGCFLRSPKLWCFLWRPLLPFWQWLADLHCWPELKRLTFLASSWQLPGFTTCLLCGSSLNLQLNVHWISKRKHISLNI